MKIKPPRLIAFFLILLIFMLFYTSCKYDYHTLEDTSTPIASQTIEKQFPDPINTEEDTLPIAETSEEALSNDATVSETVFQDTEPIYISSILDAYPKNTDPKIIYDDVLDKNWVVMTEGWTKGKNLESWGDFLIQVNNDADSSICIAYYITWNDLSPIVKRYNIPEDYPQITLTELVYDSNAELFLLTNLYVKPNERSTQFYAMPYLLSSQTNLTTQYYLGEYSDSKPPDWSISPHGFSVYVFIDGTKNSDS